MRASLRWMRRACTSLPSTSPTPTARSRLHQLFRLTTFPEKQIYIYKSRSGVLTGIWAQSPKFKFTRSQFYNSFILQSDVETIKKESRALFFHSDCTTLRWAFHPLKYFLLYGVIFPCSGLNQLNENIGRG